MSIVLVDKDKICELKSAKEPAHGNIRWKIRLTLRGLARLERRG